MVVNSVIFWLFFLIVLLLYYSAFLKENNRQNIILLFASYFFYWYAGGLRLVALLIFTTIVFYYLGIIISRYNGSNEKKASCITTLGVVIGIGQLLYFKYFNFFLESLSDCLGFMGLNTNWSSFTIIIPIGVSFYTFKLISYLIEIHRESMPPCKNIVSFATYISFFPTILSGPIDRPSPFIQQLTKSRSFIYSNISEGCKRILWGMFLKMCVADNLVAFTDLAFNNYSSVGSTTLITASIFYAFQLYTDFSGYTEMAIGVSMILGLRIQENFHRPFFAHDMAEYWRRWHISLTNWLTDYLFTPLSLTLRNWGVYGSYIAILVNLFVIGMWHGANWAYAVFGIYHGILLVIVSATNKKRKTIEKKHSLKNNALYQNTRVILTFILIVIGDTIFRADSATDVLGYIHHMFGPLGAVNGDIPLFSVLCIILLLFKEYKDEHEMNIHFLHSKKLVVKVITAYILLMSIFFMGNTEGQQFIYFQF